MYHFGSVETVLLLLPACGLMLLAERWRVQRRRAYAAAIVEADDPEAKPACDPTDDPFRGVFALRREIIHAERCVLLEMHRRGEIHDRVLHRLERELDLDEQRARHER